MLILSFPTIFKKINFIFGHLIRCWSNSLASPEILLFFPPPYNFIESRSSENSSIFSTTVYLNKWSHRDGFPFWYVIVSNVPSSFNFLCVKHWRMKILFKDLYLFHFYFASFFFSQLSSPTLLSTSQCLLQVLPNNSPFSVTNWMELLWWVLSPYQQSA